jgi:TetR/AcrR family transcriptional regulator
VFDRDASAAPALDGAGGRVLHNQPVRLTKQLVNSRTPRTPRTPRTSRTPRRRPIRRDPRTADGSRDRLLEAAAREFAARGFAGASVDRIAAAARLNKAMIYYHFKSKADLYRQILREMFQAVGVRVRDVAGSSAAPADKLKGFVEALAAEAEARPHFPPIWFREIAEGGRHLDATVFRDMSSVIQGLVAIMDEGARLGRFERINPLLIHAGIVAPLLLFFASRELRERLERSGVAGAADFDRQQVVDHLHRVSLGILEGRV